MEKAKILYCGHATVIITTEKGKRIIVDPWLDGNPQCPSDLIEQSSLDCICLTHGHSDHCASAISLATETGATLYATFELAVLMQKQGIPAEQIEFMNKGGSVKATKAPGVTISLTNAFHSSSYNAADGNTYYAGEPCGVVVTLESGRSIYHAGDTCLFSDMVLISKKFQPVVSLLPVGDRFTMDPGEAALAAGMLGSEITIPIHCETFPILTGRAEELAEKLRESRTRPVILSPGEAIEV